MMSSLTKKRIESLRKHLAWIDSASTASLEDRRNHIPEVAGVRAVRRLGIDDAKALLARIDSGDESAVEQLVAACRE